MCFVRASGTGCGTSAVTAKSLSQPNREYWAVVIGINEYASSHIQRLAYRVADADAMYQMLIGFLGFKKDNVRRWAETWLWGLGARLAALSAGGRVVGSD